MDNKLAIAANFIKQGKFKKAYPILKKINNKKLSFESGELEASCLFSDKKYKQCILLLDKLSKLAANDTEKKSLYANQATIYEKLELNEKAAAAYKKHLEIDDSPNTAEKRLKLCLLLIQTQQFEDALNFSHKLRSLSQFYSIYLLINYTAYISLGESSKASEFIALYKSNIKEFPSEQIIKFTQEVQKHSEQDASEFLNYVEQVFGDVDWIKLYRKSQEQLTITKTLKRSNNAFPTITSKSNKIKTVLEKICKIIINHGGYISPNVTIQENEGDLSIYYQSNETIEGCLIDLPASCCPILSDYRFELDNRQILVATAKSNLKNPDAKEMMSLVIELYNLTNKMEHWTNSNLLYKLRENKEILEKILVPFKKSELLHVDIKALLNDDKESFLINSFLSSRKFSYPNQILQRSGIKTKETHEYVLIPIIDLINHKLDSKGYQLDAKTGSLEVHQPSSTYNGELFVRYNLDDPCITLFLYGFVDTEAPFFYSVPINSQIDQLSLQIDNVFSFGGAKPPANLADYNAYYPNKVVKLEEQLYLSNLALPTSSKITRFIDMLSYFLNKEDTTPANNVRSAAIQLAVAIYQANLNYWQQTSSLISQQIEEDKLDTEHATLLSTLVDYAQKHFKQGIYALQSL